MDGFTPADNTDSSQPAVTIDTEHRTRSSDEVGLSVPALIQQLDPGQSQQLIAAIITPPEISCKPRRSASSWDQAGLGCTRRERSVHFELSACMASSFLHNIAAWEDGSGIIYVEDDDFTTESGARPSDQT